MRIFTKISTSLVLIFIFLSGLPIKSHSQIIQINTGAVSAPTYSVGPIYMSATLFYKYSRFAYLYTQSELAAAGILPGSTITTVGWMKSTSGSSSGAATYKIYMKNSSVAAYSNATETWANLSAAATLVYNNAAQTVPATASPTYIDFTLNTPFVYTGGSLEILTEWDASAVTAPIATGAFEWVNTVVVDRIYASGNSTMPTTLSSTSNNINMDNKRPVIQFTLLSSPCTSPVAAGTATKSPVTNVCPNATVNLDVTGSGSGSGITYEWESSPNNAAGSYVSIGASQTTTATTVQPAVSTWYRCKVVCSGGAPSYSTPVQVIVDAVMVNLGNDTTYCEGNTAIVLNAGNAGSTYLWNDASTAQTKSVNTAGTYSVTVTSAAGCVGADTIVVDFSPAAAGDFTTAEGANGLVNFTATATNTTTYFWQFGSNNATATGNPTSYTYANNGFYNVTLNLINACGDTTKVTKSVNVTTRTVGINEIIKDAKVSVFPNPATDVLIIENENRLLFEQIKIVDVLGRIVYSAQKNGSKNEYKIDIQHLNSGSYYLQIQTPEGRIVKAFSVK